jgi:predicted RNase H-like HicB family nuclease
MKKFTAVVHKGEPGEGGFWATCLEVPGANGQGETRAECLDSLASAIRELIEISRSEVASQDPDAEITELLVA